MVNIDSYRFVIEHYGCEQCNPNHNFGFGVKTSYLIVFILEGTGIFEIDKRVHKLSRNDVFLVPPHKIHKYKSDKENPWKYAWISFSVDNFEDEFKQIHNDEHLRKVKNVSMIEKHVSRIKRNENFEKSEYKCTREDALVKLFLTEMLSEDHNIVLPQKIINADKIKDYIENNYFSELLVDEIADRFNYNRSYMCRLFKSVHGKSPKEFIIDYKIQIACKLLLESDLSVDNVSNSVGYKDPFNFSKMFKKRIGLPPQEYKKYIEKTLKQYF